MGIFDYRRNYKPFEYPEVTDFTDAINKSFWVHSEVDFTADTQDFLSHLSEAEQNAVKNALLAIAQIEVNVKTFWGDLYSHLPKPEFNGLGSTFAECEFRHSEAYSRLLEVLGYNDEFERLIEIPIIKQRVDYLGGILDIDSRLKALNNEKLALEEIKNEATSTSDKLQVQTQLRYINQDIEMLQGQREFYEKSTSYSTLTLEIREGSGVSLFSWNYYVQRALSWIEAIIGIFISLSIAIGPLVLIYFVVKRTRNKS